MHRVDLTAYKKMERSDDCDLQIGYQESRAANLSIMKEEGPANNWYLELNRPRKRGFELAFDPTPEAPINKLGILLD